MKSALPPLIDKDCIILILGTMPGDKSIALQQYYGNRGNHFWKILLTVLKEEFTENYEDRKAVVTQNRIGLWNVLQHCEREGSSDSNIQKEQPNDFKTLFSHFPNIKYVFFESQAAARFYKKYTAERTGIIYSILPSTSGLNARLSYAEKLAGWQKLGEVFCNR